MFARCNGRSVLHSSLTPSPSPLYLFSRPRALTPLHECACARLQGRQPRPKTLQLRPELNPRPCGANMCVRHRVMCGKGILVDTIITTTTTTTSTIKRAQMTKGASG
jgi:hypothetical protein